MKNAPVLLERHGAVSVGSASASAAGPALAAALSTAIDRLELVDVLCRVWRDAVLLRAALGRRGPFEAPKEPDGSV
ncbi:MAG: hypothetical protein ABI598_05325 [Chloroflexota bacterium]